MTGCQFNHTTKQFVVVSRLMDYYILTNYSEIGEEKGPIKMPLGISNRIAKRHITSHRVTSHHIRVLLSFYFMAK